VAQEDHLAKRKAKIDLTAQTVGAWLEFWLREHVAPGLKPKTIDWYRYLVEHYVLPAIGDMLLDSLNADHLIVLQNQLRTQLADRTVNRVLALIKRALKKAVQSRKLLYNPADAIDPPRVPRSNQTGLTIEQERALRCAIGDHRLALLYDLALLQGLRRGELLGLLISEYNAALGTIKVTGQIQTIDGETKRHSSPKSENGIRELPLTPRQQQLIETHLARLRDERARLGLEWHEHGLIFPSEVGTPMIPRNLSRHYYKALKRAQLHTMAFHRLRHTAATRLDSIKATEACKAAILGHGPASVTGGYIHVSLDDKRAALLESEREMLKRVPATFLLGPVYESVLDRIVCPE